MNLSERLGMFDIVNTPISSALTKRVHSIPLANAELPMCWQWRRVGGRTALGPVIVIGGEVDGEDDSAANDHHHEAHHEAYAQEADVHHSIFPVLAEHVSLPYPAPVHSSLEPSA
jgi:hypothetical protein